MKHHYLILILFVDKETGKRFNHNYTFYGTQKQAEKKTKDRIRAYRGIDRGKVVKADLLRVDKLSFIKSYKEGDNG